MARVLAIDFGRKRVGLAISDLDGIAISNLTQLHFNAQDFWQKLSTVVTDYQPATIVVGWPAHEGPGKTIQKEINEFIAALTNRFPACKVDKWDESNTSIDANEVYEQVHGHSTNKKKQSRKKAATDSLAAHLLLRSYLNREAD